MVGGFAERTVVDQASVVVIDRDIPLDLASLVACGVPAGVGAARYRARVRPGESVLVVGCGGDGMNVVQGAVLSGATKIIAADIVQAKIDWAREFGATHGLIAHGDHLTRAVLALTDGIGVDHAFVCIDPPETLLPAFQIPELLVQYRQGALKLRELITRTYRLDEINRGYADLDAGKNLRGVVVFDH
jgi:Zn-dependent alcohol dehydrogenase